MTRPLRVSVIIPTHNRRELLLQLLESLLRQTLPREEFEIIVVCDGVTDGTPDKVRELAQKHSHLRLVEQTQGGPAAARNAGAKSAKAGLLAFTDDDCVATPEWLRAIIEPFDRIDVVAVEGRTSSIEAEFTPLTHQVVGEGKSNTMPTCNAACRREAFEQLGGFAVEFPFPHNEDADLAWRLEQRGIIFYEAKAVIIHPPRPEGFKKKVLWVRYLESEFLLFARNPDTYRKYRGASPWQTIYWNEFVISQFKMLKSSAKFLIRRRQPKYFAIGTGIVFARWIKLVSLYPNFLRASRRISPKSR